MPDDPTPAATPQTPAAGAPAPAATPQTPAGDPPAPSGAAVPPAPAGGDPKPGEAQPPAASAQTPPKGAPPAVVPDTYTLTAPEGATLDAAGVEMFTPLFKEAGLSNELAQKLVTANATYQAQLAAKQTEAWLAESKADKEIGGDKFDATAKSAQAAFAKFGSPALKEFMEKSGLGNHPEFLRTFAKIGAASQEDSTFIKGSGGQGERTAAEVLYPNQA